MKWQVKSIFAAIILLFPNLVFIDQSKAALFAFSSHTFTPCETTGATGPTLSSCITAYSSTSFEDNLNHFDVSSGIQIWTVPTSGSYTITAAGAKGGFGRVGSGGSGATITGTFTLTEGAKLKIIVGQTIPMFLFVLPRFDSITLFHMFCCFHLPIDQP